jgi:hypothetical protein
MPNKTLFKAPPGCGLPIGNLTSQFFANVYLDPLDQFVKHRLKARYYLLMLTDFLGGESYKGLTAAGGEAILAPWLGRVYNLPLASGLRRTASCFASYGFPPPLTSFFGP